MLSLLFLCPPLCCGIDTLRVAGANDFKITGFFKEYSACEAEQEEPVDTILLKLRQGMFHEVPQAKAVSKGFSNCTHWYALVLHNDLDHAERYLWSFYNAGLEFTLYEADESAGDYIELGKLSHHLTIKQRQVPVRSLSFDLPMHAGETKLLLLKVVSLSKENVYFRTDISTMADIMAYEARFSFLLAQYFGFYICAVIFNLVLFVVLRKKFYALMLGYVLSLLAFNLIEYLYDVYFLPDFLYPYWAKLTQLVFLALALYFNGYVFSSFVKLKRFKPKLHRLLSIVNQVCLAVVLVYCIFEISTLVSDSYVLLLKSALLNLVLFQFCFSLFLYVYALLLRIPNMLHFLLGISLLLLSVILYAFNVFNIMYLPQLVSPSNVIFSFTFQILYLMVAFTVAYRNEVALYAANLVASAKARKLLVSQLMSVEEQERKRISQDVHDGIGSAIHGVRLLLSVEKLSRREDIDKSITQIGLDIRQLVYKIYPLSLETFGLFTTLKNDIVRYGSKPIIVLECLGDDSFLSKDLQVSLYRIYQELLINSIKHAPGVENIHITVAVDQSEVRMMMEDDGDAVWDVEKARLKGGFGLSSIQSRIDYYGGSFDMHSADKGTSFVLTIPIN